MSQNTLHLTDDTFQAEVVESKVPVLVDFWAEWCMPCKMLGPVIDELATEYAGKIKVVKMDTDACRATAMKFDIRAIPTVILLKDGKIAKKFVGLQQKADFKLAIDAALQ